MPIMSIGSTSGTTRNRRCFVGKLASVPVITSNPSPLKVYGITKDGAGAPLGNVTVKLFNLLNDVIVATTISDAVGVYSFDVALTDGPFYTVEYLTGSPDKFGSSVNTLVGQVQV